MLLGGWKGVVRLLLGGCYGVVRGFLGYVNCYNQ